MQRTIVCGLAAIAVACACGCGQNVDPVVDPCGDGMLDDGEECEDGNVSTGDGCDGECVVERIALPCLGEAPPLAASDPIVVESFLLDVATSTQAAAAGTLIEALDPLGAATAMGVANMNGYLALSIATGGVPFAGSFRASRADYVAEHLVYTWPFAADTTLPTSWGMLTPDALDGFYFGAGLTRTPGAATLQVIPYDCDVVPLTGVTVTVDPPAARLAYVEGDGAIVGDATETTAAAFVAMAFDVPAGEVTVTLDYRGLALTTRTVTTLPGEITALFAKP